MRKSIFILATIFAATAASAQITLEKTLDGFYTISANIGGDLYHYEQSPYFYNHQIQTNEPSVPNDPIQGAPRRSNANNNKCVLNLYDADDFSLYKTVEIDNVSGSTVCLVSRNILTTDNKVCFCITGGDEHSYIYNEDGQLIATINGDGNIPPSLLRVNDRYLLVSRQTYNKTYIYSVPGNGEAQAVSTPSSPKRFARKISRDGQVLVQTDTNTYTLTGAEVK